MEGLLFPQRLHRLAHQRHFTAARCAVPVQLLRRGKTERWRKLMAEEHYLGDGGTAGESLRYVVMVDGQCVALLASAAAAWCCAPRDRLLGWSQHLRKRRLPYIANNTRFLILDGVRMPNLASAVLAENTKRLAVDWRRVHHRSLLLAETFVDPARPTTTPARQFRLRDAVQAWPIRISHAPRYITPAAIPPVAARRPLPHTCPL